MHAYGIFLIENASIYRRLFYALYAAGQCFIEVGVLFFLTNILVKQSWKVLSRFVVTMTFILFMIHIVDFPLVRFMDLSVWYVLNFMLDESLENFIEMLRAANIPLKTWALTGFAILSLPLFAALFYNITNLIAKRKPWNPSSRKCTYSLFFALMGLSAFDYQVSELISGKDQSRFLKSLPWKKAIFIGTHPILNFTTSLKKAPTELEMHDKCSSISCDLVVRKPNAFLFIIESLRHDFLTQEIAPHMSKFREDNISFEYAFSSSNVTMLSWFSLFHSSYPHYWRNSHEHGSIPLQILKKIGYQTHFYSSARLSFYEMDRNILGKDGKLADTLQVFPYEGLKKAYESDALCFEHLKQDLHKYREEDGHLFVIFLDSTHFDYSYPTENEPQFAPVVKSIDYVNLFHSKDNLEFIKNRYRNAIHYVDALFGDFFTLLMQEPMGKEAVVIVTGDHGEEFYEEGNIFHATNLSSMQTQVPLYYRFGDQKVTTPSNFTSHIDIFPSLFDYVFGDERFSSLFDGESIFREKQRPYAISARYNARRPPFEFFIHNGKEKMIARFIDESNIFESRSLKIISRKSANDEPLSYDENELKTQFGHALNNLFSQG